MLEEMLGPIVGADADTEMNELEQESIPPMLRPVPLPEPLGDPNP